MGEQRIILKNHADFALFRRDEVRFVGDNMIADLDAAARWLFKTSEQAQGRCLAAAARAEQGEKLARAHTQRDIVDGRQLTVEDFA